MIVKFWGVRGSIASPGPQSVRYGGNTSCVEVRTDGGELLIFDSGTGIRALGEDPEHCEFLVGQWVHASRGGKAVSLSKRKGESISFEELIDEVGASWFAGRLAEEGRAVRPGEA